MKIIQKYPIDIEHWGHAPIQDFTGHTNDYEHIYIFGITPEDPNSPDCIYINIGIEKKIINTTTDKITFFAKTVSTYKIKNDFEIPTVQFFFELVVDATYDYAKEFYTRTRHTNLATRKTKKPMLQELKGDLEHTITIWKEKYMNSKSRPKPDWQQTFRDLPAIPRFKQWEASSYTTIEQDISMKLMKRKPITKEEEDIFSALSSFYEQLEVKLPYLDYTSFSPEETKNFENYIFYAFTYLGLVTDKITVYQTYRIIVNQDVIGQNEPISDVRYLKYPPQEVVKEKGNYNRANTPNTTLFYSAENINTALREIRPAEKQLVTAGIWRPIAPDFKLNCYVISHGLPEAFVNEGVAKANKAFGETKRHNHHLFIKYMEYYFRILGREFTKRTKNHKEFMVSALFSEQVLKNENRGDDEFIIDGILYPSVGNDYKADNIAILPECLERNFQLSEVVEFEIEEQYYERSFQQGDLNAIQVAKVKNLRKARSITPDGKIEW